jgi:hypothetical protein
MDAGAKQIAPNEGNPSRIDRIRHPLLYMRLFPLFDIRAEMIYPYSSSCLWSAPIRILFQLSSFGENSQKAL